MKLLINIVIFLALINNHTYATIFPYTQIPLSDIAIISDARVETDFRLHLLEQAKRNIRLLTYDFQLDEQIGQPIFRELVKAAQRGVSVQFACSKQALVAKDRTARAESFMKYFMEIYPSMEFITVGNVTMMDKGWSIFDTLHSKLLIIDDHIALVSGRSQDASSLSWLDSAIVFKGNLLAQAVEAFHATWKSIESENRDIHNHNYLSSIRGLIYRLVTPDLYDITARDVDRLLKVNTPSLLQTAQQREELDKLIEWNLSVPASDEPAHISARVIRHDFFEQMMTHVSKTEQLSDYPPQQRAMIDDHIMESVIEALYRAEPDSEFILSTYAIIMHPKLKAALINALQTKKIRATILTNSKEIFSAHSQKFSKTILPFGYYASLADMDDLLQNGARVFFLNSDTYSFLHQKLVIVGNNVFIGSHNMTKSSTFTLEELTFQFNSVDFAERLKNEFNTIIKFHAYAANPHTIHRERSETSFLQKMSEFCSLIY